MAFRIYATVAFSITLPIAVILYKSQQNDSKNVARDSIRPPNGNHLTSVEKDYNLSLTTNQSEKMDPGTENNNSITINVSNSGDDTIDDLPLANDEYGSFVDKKHAENVQDSDFKEIVKDCMEQKGYAYFVSNEVNPLSFDEAQLDENDAYVNSLSLNERKKYLLALYGKREPTSVELQTSSYPGRKEGCMDSASRQNDPTTSAMLEIQNRLVNSRNSDSLQSNAGVVSATVQWSKCMGENGLFYNSPPEFFASLLPLMQGENTDEVIANVEISRHCEQVSGLKVKIENASQEYK